MFIIYILNAPHTTACEWFNVEWGFLGERVRRFRAKSRVYREVSRADETRAIIEFSHDAVRAYPSLRSTRFVTWPQWQKYSDDAARTIDDKCRPPPPPPPTPTPTPNDPFPRLIVIVTNLHACLCGLKWHNNDNIIMRTLRYNTVYRFFFSTQVQWTKLKTRIIGRFDFFPTPPHPPPPPPIKRYENLDRITVLFFCYRTRIRSAREDHNKEWKKNKNIMDFIKSAWRFWVRQTVKILRFQRFNLCRITL